jgi:hypothetical protein
MDIFLSPPAVVSLLIKRNVIIIVPSDPLLACLDSPSDLSVAMNL